MIRSLVLATVYGILLWVASFSSPSPILVLLSEDQLARLVAPLRWLLALALVREINAGLSCWAENKWLWTNDKNAWDWKSEVAVVTGGSNGIGAMVVKKLASHGIKVAVLDVQPLSKELQNDEGNLIKLYKCDITCWRAVHAAGNAIRSDHGSPSILINNAGIGNANTILEVTPERLRTIFDVNLISHWNTVQEFLPDMISKNKGHIMSTASLAAFFGLAGMVDYSCTKAGLIAFHEGLSQELKHRYNAPKIKTSIVYPNWTKTRLITAIEKNISTTKAPLVDPTEVATTVVNHILRAKSGQLILGPQIVASMRALPTWLQELVRDKLAQVVDVNATSAVA
ncbi:NAD(P)-binding protein [Lojkania enalia]|uniref:Short-chain dehydrogenase/reductase 3 n=1 Tax=Lojkania enalia TaxID=147567 RepID=A0A9P4K5Y6_9PLEO|nr:NAD(P)-binding protein [Didymosphaeria enalia]